MISRPVYVTKIQYEMPLLLCPKPTINGKVGGMTMVEFQLWGQKSWNWISTCYNSIITESDIIRINNS